MAIPSNDKTVIFIVKESPLSNHYLCEFIVENTTYNYMELYIMKSKALHFDDTDIACKVMEAINQGVQKGLGKKVAGFVKEEWDKEVPTMLIKGLRAKFSQVGFCNEFLKDHW